MDFRWLNARLLAALRAHLQSGELSERRFARSIGISQPHVHNVLKGVRFLSPDTADRILRRSGISLLDLLEPKEVRERFCLRCAGRGTYREVLVLEGKLGPGLPLPRAVSGVERFPFPLAYLASVDKPVLVRVHADPRMAPAFREDDVLLLDHSRWHRSHPQPEHLYVVNRFGEGIVRRLRVADGRLHLICEDALQDPARWQSVALSGHHILDLVQARVAWLVRRLN